MYLKYVNQNKSTLLAKNIADNYHIMVWDYSQDPYFLNHQELFSDKGHLNVKGATIFQIW